MQQVSSYKQHVCKATVVRIIKDLIVTININIQSFLHTYNGFSVLDKPLKSCLFSFSK